jgi:hypothetical protein
MIYPAHALDLTVTSVDSFDLEIEEVSNPLVSFDNCLSTNGTLSTVFSSLGGSSLSSGASISTAACYSGGS